MQLDYRLWKKNDKEHTMALRSLCTPYIVHYEWCFVILEWCPNVKCKIITPIQYLMMRQYPTVHHGKYCTVQLMVTDPTVTTIEHCAEGKITEKRENGLT